MKRRVQKALVVFTILAFYVTVYAVEQRETYLKATSVESVPSTKDGVLVVESDTQKIKICSGPTCTYPQVVTNITSSISEMHFSCLSSGGVTTCSLIRDLPVPESSGGTGTTVWPGVRFITLANDVSFTSTTAVSSGMSWPVSANKTYAFSCNLSTTNTSTSLARFAFDAPSGSSARWHQILPNQSSAGTNLSTNLLWTTPCTGCTGAVTSSVFLISTHSLSGFIKTTNSGNITLMGATSAGTVPNTLIGGSWCWWKEE